MSLNENAAIDTSQVSDVGSSGGGGGFGGVALPTGGGGWIGLVVLLLLVVGGVVGGNTLLGDGDTGAGTGTALDCSKNNPDRFENVKCRDAAYVNSIQAYWQRALPQTLGTSYQVAKTIFFSNAVNTACGAADSGVGPFYCPGDDQVYIDVSFWDELANRFGAGGEFAQAYVLAHEYGHHVQDLVGTEASVRRQMERDPTNRNALSVRTELQADCYAGAWASHATRTTDASGVPIFTSLTQTDINEALEAAAAVGDDAIQGSSANESSFTHGSSADRQKWFNQGYRTGDPEACNTFSS
jgi:predicted metalloprotease